MSRIQVPGSVYQRESGRWTAITPEILDESQGRRRRISLGTFDTRQEAVEALTAFHEKRDQSALTVADIRRMKLSEYLAEWLTLVEAQVGMGHLARRTYSGHEEAVRLHIAPALGEVRVGDLNHLVVYRWLVGLREAKGLADWTVSRIYRSLHRAMADAPLPENPVVLPRHMRSTRQNKNDIVRPNPRQVRQFLGHTASCPRSAYLHPVWRLAAATGMRRGELAGVAWDDVDLDEGTVQVVRSIGVDRGVVFSKTPKSSAGVRTLGLDAETVSVLRKHRLRLRTDRLAAAKGYVDRPLDLDLVFRRGPRGGLLRPDRLSTNFKREWAHAALADGVTLHGLRHMTASILASSGMSLVEVAAHMGHSVEVLERIYARSIDPVGREQRVVDVVTDALDA